MTSSQSTRLYAALLLTSWAALGHAQGFPVILDVQERAVLSAERDGVLTRLDVDVADPIRRGAVLAAVYAGDLAIQRRQAQAQRDFLNKQFENLSNLNKRGLATDEEVAKTEADLARANAEIDLLTSEINRSVIRAPFDGLVVQRAAREHEWVTAGKPVVEVLNPKKVRIIANLPANLVVHLRPGDQHMVYVPDLKQEIAAVVRSTVPAVDEQSNTIGVVWDIVDPPEGLLAGMKGELKL